MPVYDDLVLLPRPQRLTVQPERFTPPAERDIVLATPDLQPAGRVVQEALRQLGARWTLNAADPGPAFVGARVLVDPDQVAQPQGYTLAITPDGITLTARDAAGAFYGAQTLRQIARQSARQSRRLGTGSLPCLVCEDWPDFAQRGVMLDISRDKVPTLTTLLELIDLLAAWKINEFQLYTEHTFAFRGHEVVWQQASPLTPEDILRLDAYCRERYIELVPNQNSFGHMTRWLKHDAYAHLAEAPDGFDTPWGERRHEPFSLSPTVPSSLDLLRDLFGQLLPNFASRQVNVGCDETWDLGQPGARSEAACNARGVGRVYLDFLTQIRALIPGSHTMQFWADIILNHPELIPELPGESVALIWGYEADHPFARQCAQVAAAGVPFYVCPGTSSWNTLAGRTDNALANLLNAAENGLKHGAVGYLNTDWGDNGHWQPLPVSYLGFATGAALGWAVDANRDLAERDALADALDLYAFRDRAGVMGRLAVDLGNIYQQAGQLVPNASALFRLLLYFDRSLADAWLSDLSAEALARAADTIEDVMLPLAGADLDRLDARLVEDEFTLAARLLRHACRLGLARLKADGAPTRALPTADRARLAAELEPLLEDYRRIWLLRNRPGGLADSVGRLEALLAAYRA